MKRLLGIALLMSAYTYPQLTAIEKIKDLASALPRDEFIIAITKPTRSGESVLEAAQENPRLYAALNRAQTSLTFSDAQLQEKLKQVQAEQDLIVALEQQNLGTLFEALKDGADVNTQTEAGHTALMLAVLKADKAAVQDLLKQGARTSSKGEFILDGADEPEHMSAQQLAQRLGYQPLANLLRDAE